MARRRWLSTNISIDGPVNRLAMQYGDFAALLFTWMIPAAGDDGVIRGDPEEILAQVMPHRRDVTGTQVAEALGAMASAEFGLIEWDGRVVRFKRESYYGYQSYIREERRGDAAAGAAAFCGDDAADQRTKAAFRGADAAQQRTTAQSRADQRTSPQNAAFVNPSSSLALVPDQDQQPGVEVIPEGEGEPPRAPARPRASQPPPVGVPSLDELAAAFAPWAAERGVAAAALREDLGRWRNDALGRELADRSRRAWLALAEKWLSNVDYGPAARRGGGGQRARASPAEREPVGRDEAKLARSLTTIAQFRGRGGAGGP